MKSILCVFSLALLSWATPSSTQSQTEIFNSPTIKIGQEAPWFSATLADNQYGVVNRDLLLKSAQKEGTISLPKTVLLDSKGKILGVYGSEGNDYLSSKDKYPTKPSSSQTPAHTFSFV